jgi:L-ascorbate metabolism protein UlaG (beta-lactamase superfamily)
MSIILAFVRDEEFEMAWRQITDWGKRSDRVLRLADRLGRGKGQFRLLDRAVRPAAAPRPELAGWSDQELSAIWLGHATTLLRLGGITVLTDPVFSNRVGLELGLVTGGPRRLIAPALSIHELPPIDLIVISHAHFDHLDRPSLHRLDKSIPVMTAPRTADLIRDLGFQKVTELAWGESRQIDAVRVTAWEAKHWGARTLTDWDRGYNAYLLESGGRRLLYGGDTAYGRHFAGLNGVDLAVLGIAAYDPYIAAHATPEQALAMADQMRAEHILPMHHSTFRLSHEPMHEPLARLLDAVGTQRHRLVIHEVGGQWAA